MSDLEPFVEGLAILGFCCWSLASDKIARVALLVSALAVCALCLDADDAQGALLAGLAAVYAAARIAWSIAQGLRAPGAGR